MIQRKRQAIVLLVISWCAAGASAQLLGSASSFSVLGGSTVTNTGASQLSGAVGVWPGTAITGFPLGVALGGIHPGDDTAQQAHLDAANAFAALGALAPTRTLSGLDLGGMTLFPGVYFFSSSALLTGTLTLDGLGDPDSSFIFQIGSTFGTATGSSVLTINGADGCNVYWQVGSSATLGTGSIMQGSVLADQSITMTTGSNFTDGRLLAINGAVTLDTNLIETTCLPVPASAIVVAAPIWMGLSRTRRRRCL